LTVTTNGAGRAAATGLTATGRGAVQIAASAAFQGETAAVSIAQTTVMTAAEASSVASGTGAAGAGGGLSHGAIAAIAGGAGAGIAGAVIASRRVPPKTLTGPFSGQLVMTMTVVSQSGSDSCASTRSINGTMTIQLEERSDGS